MNKILEFLTKNRVSILAINLPDGTPHTAALHYSHSADPFVLFFSTKNSDRKCLGLLNGETQKASVTVGFSEDEWVTLQMDGVVEIVKDKNEIAKIQEKHYEIHPNSAKFKDDPATVFLKFTPTWFRYTDYNTDPVTFISSEDK